MRSASPETGDRTDPCKAPPGPARGRLRLRALLALRTATAAWIMAGGAVLRADSGAGRLEAPAPVTTLAVRQEAAPAESPGAPQAPARDSPYRAFEGPLAPPEERLFADAADGRLDRHSLLEAALIAGGTLDEEAVRRYEARLDALAAELARSKAVAGPPRKQAEAIFEFMHRRILTGGYHLNASDVGETLDRGRFNCVSASLLYNCLAGRFGIEARGLEVPGHAMSRLVLAGQTLDVETTCPRWFELMSDPEKQADLVAETTGFRHAQGASPAGRREVDGTELVATVYYNRGVDLLAGGRFPEALAANAKALRLDPANATARGNLLATLNNWAIALGRAGQHAEAAAVLRRGLALDPSYATFDVNFTHVHHQWAECLAREGRFAEALDLLAEAGAERPQTAYFRQGQVAVGARWARACLAAGDVEQAFAVLSDVRRRFGNCPAVLESEAATLNDYALGLLDQGRFEEALAVFDRALAAQPGSVLLRDNRRAALMRWAEPAFLGGEYAEAIRRTTLGAKPGELHEALVGNVCYGYYHWIQSLASQGRREEARRVTQQALADPFLAGRADRAIPPER